MLNDTLKDCTKFCDTAICLRGHSKYILKPPSLNKKELLKPTNFIIFSTPIFSCLFYEEPVLTSFGPYILAKCMEGNDTRNTQPLLGSPRPISS